MKWDGWNELTSPGSFIEFHSNYAAVGYEFSARAHHISSPLTSFPIIFSLSQQSSFINKEREKKKEKGWLSERQEEWRSKADEAELNEI